MSKNTTKKFPVSLTFGGVKARTNEFVIPLLKAASKQNLFLGIKTGETHSYAAMSYIGKNVDAADVIEKLVAADVDVGDQIKATETIEEYIERIKHFRVGNVLAIEYSGNDYLLKKVANRPPQS